MYIETCERSQAVNSLSMTLQMLNKSRPDINLRWVVIGLHSSVQEFMILWIMTKNEKLLFSNNKARKSCKASETLKSDETLPKEEWLKGFDALYKQTKKLLKVHNLRIIEKQNTSIKKLNSLRNTFTHFSPKSWLLDSFDLPEIFVNCLDFIELLGWNINHDVFQGSHDLSDRAKIHIVCLKEELNSFKETLEKFNELTKSAKG